MQMSGYPTYRGVETEFRKAPFSERFVYYLAREEAYFTAGPDCGRISYRNDYRRSNRAI